MRVGVALRSFSQWALNFLATRNLRLSGFRLLTGAATSLFAWYRPLRMLLAPVGQAADHGFVSIRLHYPEGHSEWAGPPLPKGRGAAL